MFTCRKETFIAEQMEQIGKDCERMKRSEAFRMHEDGLQGKRDEEREPCLSSCPSSAVLHQPNRLDGVTFCFSYHCVSCIRIWRYHIIPISIDPPGMIMMAMTGEHLCLATNDIFEDAFKKDVDIIKASLHRRTLPSILMAK